jgi:mannose-1-phosphate guanylyltransferase
MIKFHFEHGKLATMMLKKVDNPSRFGVVCAENIKEKNKEFLKINNFIEKPQEFISNLINAGVYILSKKILSMINKELDTPNDFNSR